MQEAAVSTAAAMVSEARDLVSLGWCQGAHAQDSMGHEVLAWNGRARSWSLLGALLASWHRHHTASLNDDVTAHLAEARTLGDAMETLGLVVGTASLEQWNDDPKRTQAEVVAAFDDALRLLD